jgi:hypothetical protein
MRSIVRVAVVIGMLALTRSGGAQHGGRGAFMALTLTPYGALPPVVIRTMLLDEDRPAGFEIRYGRSALDDARVGTFGVGGEFRAPRGSGGFAMGLRKCSSCDDIFMAGFDYTAVLTKRLIGPDLDMGMITIGLRPSAGIARSTPDTGYVVALAGAIDVPISVAIRLGHVAQIIPFISPGTGYGRLAREGETEPEGGWRYAVGGGVGLVGFNNGLGMNISFRKVFVDDRGFTTWGLGLTIGG